MKQRRLFMLNQGRYTITMVSTKNVHNKQWSETMELNVFAMIGDHIMKALQNKANKLHVTRRTELRKT